MREETLRQLKRKGWSDEDINRAHEIINERHTLDKSRSTEFSNRFVYWSVIILIIIGNFLVSLVLVPVLLVTNKIALDIVIAVLGLTFGLLFNFLITNIEHIERRHHIMAALVIPLLALVNISLMVGIAEAINSVFKFGVVRETPAIAGAIYVIAFILPYLWTVLMKNRR